MVDLNKKRILIEHFHKIGVVSFPQDKDNVSFHAPYSINLKLLTSYPKELKLVAQIFGEVLKDISYDLIAGPYTDIPLATTISLEFNRPMIFVRETRKNHGTERLIEGNFKPDQRVIVVDDEVVDAASSLQLLGRLEGSGLTIAGFFVLLDRGFGALEMLRSKGYFSQALIKLNEIFLEFLQTNKISNSELDRLQQFLKQQRKEFLLKLDTTYTLTN